MPLWQLPQVVGDVGVVGGRRPHRSWDARRACRGSSSTMARPPSGPSSATRAHVRCARSSPSSSSWQPPQVLIWLTGDSDDAGSPLLQHPVQAVVAAAAILDRLVAAGAAAVDAAGDGLELVGVAVLADLRLDRAERVGRVLDAERRFVARRRNRACGAPSGRTRRPARRPTCRPRPSSWRRRGSRGTFPSASAPRLLRCRWRCGGGRRHRSRTCQQDHQRGGRGPVQARGQRLHDRSGLPAPHRDDSIGRPGTAGSKCRPHSPVGCCRFWRTMPAAN